jgi:hypothetical protein
MPNVHKCGTVDRFWDKVDMTYSCWYWRANKRGGYGQFWYEGRFVGAHRYAYELLVGKIPEGLHIDHLCKNKSCVNPAHLDPTTNRDNLLRAGTNPAAVNAIKTHCIKGHELKGNNLHINKKTGQRRCNHCHNTHNRKYEEDKRG